MRVPVKTPAALKSWRLRHQATQWNIEEDRKMEMSCMRHRAATAVFRANCLGTWSKK